MGLVLWTNGRRENKVSAAVKGVGYLVLPFHHVLVRVYWQAYQSEATVMDQSKCQKILRHNRVLIIRELPDLEILLSTPEMKLHFSAYEKMEIISQKTPSERGAKFLDKMEFKSPEVYQKFVTVVRMFKPELAIKLEGAEREISNSSTASSPVSNGSSSPPCEYHVIVMQVSCTTKTVVCYII